MKNNFLVLISVIFISFALGSGLSIKFYPEVKSKIVHLINNYGNANNSDWPEGFSIVEIESSIDRTIQRAYFFSAESSEMQPLIVSLHSWSGNYKQQDPLAKKAKDNDWNYIHPDFRGPNWTKDACLSDKALSDIDDAIQYALDKGSVNKQSIFVTGVSGGGYATLEIYLRTRHKIKAFLSWAPISDLDAWYWQSRFRGNKFDSDILKCTSNGFILDKQEALKRSPLYFELPPSLTGRLEIYAGINDGFTGSVPISHSILFFNKLVEHYEKASNVVNQEDIIRLLTRSVSRVDGMREIDGRAVLYSKEMGQFLLTIFEGGHEMLPDFCFRRMKEIIGE